ncbi:hypothetical protein [Subtercola vilae]|uniref:Uncharacterized protein n=1 Tax=Subtercola vilae TaxID=2056433 RepID=A0A4T2BSE4_9MICO|nr:hypothetical protein [Subtercola vilae]TIH32278.1 hypothetical protein D4765_15670 [Subtercola vilae]
MSKRVDENELWGSADPVEIKNAFDAIDLVQRLNDFRRDVVVVVVTPTSDGRLLFDPKAIADEIGNKGEVAVIRDPDLTFKLTEAFTQEFSVFNGGARIYPRGITWTKQRELAPLFLAPDVESARRKQPRLIEEALKLAYRSPREVVESSVAAQRTPARVIAASASKAVVATPLEVQPALVNTPLEVQPALVNPEREASPDITTEATAPALLEEVLSERDRTIDSRDATITQLNERIRLEQDRTERVAEMLLASQGKFSSSLQYWQRSDADLRELKIENANLKQKIAEQTTAHRAHLNSRRRPVTTEKVANPLSPELFSSSDEAVRHAIYEAWVERVPAAEKGQKELPSYEIGPDFFKSVEGFDRSSQMKAFRCVVDVLIGTTEALAARNVHALRLNSASLTVTREDGALCYRAYLEENTPSARRLHYWKLDGVGIELSRVVVHDDYAA